MTTEQNDDSAAEKYQQDLRDLAKNISLDSFPFYKRSNGEPINAKSIFLAGILHERKKHEWVSVKDKPLPDYDCLATDGLIVACFYEEGAISKKCITHWMPLPNPPQELEEK